MSENIKETIRAAVGMSGGVDSSVAAYLMQKAGYDITGVTLKLTCDIFTRNGPVEDSSCCSADDILRAKDNCRRFGVTHRVLNFSSTFREKIVDNFAAEYFAGRTPNPCVLCNREVKWTDLLLWMDDHDIPVLATGHYAQIHFNEVSGRYELHRAIDHSKDQSYVLWTLDQKQLARTRFPLGHLSKPDVRRIASELGLSNADKPDSQDICFVPDNNYRNFLDAYDNMKTSAIGPGNFVDPEGNILGRHKGYYHYTIGQRRGLELAMGYPVYVRAIDAEKNEVTVVRKEELGDQGCLLKNANWISVDGSAPSYSARIKIRYRHKGIFGQLIPLKSGKIVVNFKDVAESVTPGQSAVFYDRDRVLGGAVIERALQTGEEIEACIRSQ